MKNVVLLIIGFALILGCSEKNAKKINESISSFDLKKDIYNFSEKMENGDTLILNAELSVCTSESHDSNLIFKLNDSVFIQSLIEEMSPRKLTITLKKTQYKFLNNDTLNFENLFTSLKDNRTQPKYHKHYTFEIIHKMDTVKFYSENLIKILKHLEYYYRIKERIYPNETYFKPVKVPER